ncbi:MAG: DUF5620 domain-containing protein, partial [Ruminococcus sp.]
MRKSAISKRIKASALSLVVAASLPAFSIGSGVSAVSLAGVSISSVKGLSTVMEADSVYKGTFSSSGAKSITFTIDSEYGGSFSYGLGVSISESPYWTEHNSKGTWDSKGSGFSVDLKKGENTITVDLSDLNIKPGGDFEFRCYYSGHWDNSAGAMVDNSVTLTDVAFDAEPTNPGTDPGNDPGSEVPRKNRQSGEWSFTDNKDGTATISSTVTRQIEDLDYVLTAGYDEDYYLENPDEFTEDAPINSHKFYYTDFGITDGTGITIESLTATIQIDEGTTATQFMYGGGLNVKKDSPADTESAKVAAGVKESGGYWYNDMGSEQLEEYEAANVEFGVTPGNGVTLENPGNYIEAYWEVPEEVIPYED